MGKPLYYTEWCASSNPFDKLHDIPYAACFIIKTVIEANGIVEGYSFGPFPTFLKRIIFHPFLFTVALAWSIFMEFLNPPTMPNNYGTGWVMNS